MSNIFWDSCRKCLVFCFPARISREELLLPPIVLVLVLDSFQTLSVLDGGLSKKRPAKRSRRTKTGPIDLCTSSTSTNLWLRLRRSCAQYLNFAAVLRSRRRASKSGCDLTTRIIDSIAAIITPGSISPSVHSRKGSRGVGKLSQLASSQVADTSLDLAERSGSPI